MRRVCRLYTLICSAPHLLHEGAADCVLALPSCVPTVCRLCADCVPTVVIGPTTYYYCRLCADSVVALSCVVQVDMVSRQLRRVVAADPLCKVRSAREWMHPLADQLLSRCE